MPQPGEVNHAIGQAYQTVFIAALEGSVKYFVNNFTVHNEPTKTTFAGRSGKTFSFDFSGTYISPLGSREVFGESKGYSTGSGLLPDFRAFLAKAYVASMDYPRNREDIFWFVTNVPFACTEGSGIRTFKFVKEALTDKHNAQVQEILGAGHVDDDIIRSLVGRLGIFILTDSFLTNTELSYKISQGETIWSILKKIYAGQVPTPFRWTADQIAKENGLESPDHIKSGSRIRLRWQGLKSRTPIDY